MVNHIKKSQELLFSFLVSLVDNNSHLRVVLSSLFLVDERFVFFIIVVIIGDIGMFNVQCFK